MMKKGLYICALSAALLLSACQQNPDSSIVVNKDMEHLIEDAGKVDETSVAVENIAENYETYQTTLSSDAMKVSVNVDAKVDIPKTEQMSVMRVSQQPISQEFLDKVVKELGGGEKLYDGGMTITNRTRSDIESEISYLREEMEWLKGNKDAYSESAMADMLEERQAEIDKLQAEYEKTSAGIVWEGNESDGLIHSAAELNEKSGENDFYSWEYSLNPKGDVYFGVNDGKNGNYVSFFVQNNEDYGNCLRYRSGKHGYEFVAGAYIQGTAFDSVGQQPAWSVDLEPGEEFMRAMDGDTLVEDVDEPVTISGEEARATADAFIEKMGLDAFQYYEGGLYCEIPDIRYGGDSQLEDMTGVYRKVYIFRYMRNIDGAFVTFDKVGKHDEGWNGNDYVKKDWPVECVEIRVNDDGIIGFDYNAPLTVMETVVDKANMKTFDEIKDIFEQMVLVTNAQTDADSEAPQGNVTVQIDRVVLGYARISEADSFDTGLLVPVWDFEGTITDVYGNMDSGSVLTINAVDGSIIDRVVGY